MTNKVNIEIKVRRPGFPGCLRVFGIKEVGRGRGNEANDSQEHDECDKFSREK